MIFKRLEYITMTVPTFPEFAPIDIEMREELYPAFSRTPDGVSEYTFANLYLFRNKYQYEISLVRGKTYIISGRQNDRKFFMTPCSAPGRTVLMQLFDTHDTWKGISDTVIAGCRACLECRGVDIVEDRNNFDYLYSRKNLAELPGKKYHKKRNLVNAFVNAYQCEKRILTSELVADAIEVLNHWKASKEIDGDFAAAQEALELFELLNMEGAIYYVDAKPVGWCLGEFLARGRMFAVHFEKAIESYKGIYQYINQTFAAELPEACRYINREQDLGDAGLRQAKMSYRPSGFVRKYVGHRKPCGNDQ